MSLSKKCILFALMGFLMIAQNKLSAQSEPETDADIFTAKNSVHAELLGNSGGYALNYGRILHQKNRIKLWGSAGFSLRRRGSSEPIFSAHWIPYFPAEITVFLGKSKHNLELGAGFYTLRNRSYTVDESLPNFIREEIHWDQFILARIGYRYQKPEGGFFFRAAYTPGIQFFNSETRGKEVFYSPFLIGISLGYSF